MKLYIKQKVFSWVDKFTVKDSSGRDRYFVDCNPFAWGKKLFILNQKGQEIASIQHKVFTWLPRYVVSVHNQQVAEIVKEFTFFVPKYRVDGLNWTIDGSFMAHDYRIYRDGTRIASICKEWMTWGDCYVLDIARQEDELIALAVVLAIDCCLAQSSKS